MVERWVSLWNSTLTPSPSGSMSTSNPGFGIADTKVTEVDENEIAVTPPSSWKVRVDEGASVVVGGATVVVGGATVVVEVTVVGVGPGCAVVVTATGGATVVVGRVGASVVGGADVVAASGTSVVSGAAEVVDGGTGVDSVGGSEIIEALIRSGAGLITSSLTMPTPAEATAIAAAVASSQRAASAIFFTS
jgi:hypothetical protein